MQKGYADFSGDRCKVLTKASDKISLYVCSSLTLNYSEIKNDKVFPQAEI